MDMDRDGVIAEPAEEWEFFRLCPICHKAFVKDHPFKRHISYCRRAQFKRKGRPKPCDACSVAKTKCSLDEPVCKRCLSKSLICTYGTRFAEGHDLLSTLPLNGGPDLVNEPSLGFSNAMLEIGKESDSTSNADMTRPLPSVSGFNAQPTPPVNNWFNTPSQGWDNSEGLLEPIRVIPQASENPLPFSSGETVLSNRGALSTETADEPATLTTLKQANSEAAASASIILHCIRSFPQMMLRRQTFPPFIHPHWHTGKLPEYLTNCMSIAQLFVTRTSENRPFLWRTISSEVTEFKKKANEMELYAIQSAVQALLVYMIMLAIDEDDDMSSRGAQLIETFQILSFRTRDLCGGEFLAPPECTHRSRTWEDWIFAESRRRINSFYFAIREVIQARADSPCVLPDAYRQVALCSAKTMWDARTREEWEEERTIQDLGRLHLDLWNLGALLDAQRHPEDPVNARKLEIWGANTDKMGVLMSVVTVIMNQR